MQRNKILFSIYLFLTLCLFSVATNQSYASFNTTVQTQSWVHASGSSAKIGTTTLYTFIGPSGERSPQFFSSVIASTSSDHYFNVYRLRIEASAKDPNNNQIPGARIGIIGAYVSPGDTNDPVREGLSKIYDVLLAAVPYGLAELLKRSDNSGGITTKNSDPIIAYAEWSYPLFNPLQWEKGLEFGFSLNIQPTATLEGTYKIYVHYRAEIYYSFHQAPPNPAHVFDLYDTLLYTYVNTPNKPSQPQPSTPAPYYTYTSYSFSTTAYDPNGDQLRYEFNWGDGLIDTSGWFTPGVLVTMSHSWSLPNPYTISVRAQDNTGAWSPSSSLSITVDPPSSYYASSINAYGKVGTGSVGNPNNLLGSSNDGNYANLYAGNPGDSAWINATMNAPAAGHVYLFGYSKTGTNGGYVSHLVVSISSNGQSWITLYDKMISPRSSPYYIDCGSTTTYFSYIKLFVDFHNGYSASVYLDAVRVTAPSEKYVSSIYSQGHSSGGAVNNPNYLIGANDGLYTHLHASNYGDYAWIVGKMNAPATGHVYVYGYSSTGYTSHLVVYVSSDGNTWTALPGQMISYVSSPYYIDCGSTTITFSYIKFYVDYYNGYSAGLNLDAVHVLS